MSKAEWGQKHNCYKCVKPFYDMNQTPAKCPACNTLAKPDHHANHMSTLHLHANEDDIVIGRSSDRRQEILEEKLDLDFDNAIGTDIGEYFEDDLEDVIELPETLHQDRTL